MKAFRLVDAPLSIRGLKLLNYGASVQFWKVMLVKKQLSRTCTYWIPPQHCVFMHIYCKLLSLKRHWPSLLNLNLYAYLLVGGDVLKVYLVSFYLTECLFFLFFFKLPIWSSVSVLHEQLEKKAALVWPLRDNHCQEPWAGWFLS